MDFHICRDFEAVNVKTVGTDLSNDDTINRGHVQSNLTNEEHFDTKFNFKEEGEFQKEELEDIMPLSLLPKVESIHTTGQDQGHCGGEHHVLQEGVNSLLVIIKTEPDPEEISPSVHSSGKRHTLQDSADMSNPIASCRAPSVPKEMWDYESKGESQRTLEDWSSSLVVVKMEPDEGEAISSGEHSTELELGEKSSLPPLWKAEPDDPNMPYPAFDRGDPQPRLCMSSVQRADRSDSPEENEDLISSSQSRRLSSAISPGKELNGLKSYSCTECGNTFSKSSSFYRHMRIHTGERPYQCTQCNKTFIQSTSFKVHQRIHTGEKPYQCSDCGKTFRRLDNLQIHQRTHTGEKPYKCSHCPKTFTRLDVLQIHQRIHTGEKPYQCTHCCKTFTRLSVFQVHQRIHTGERPYQCSTCGKHFVDASNLKNHERTHTLERPYQCSQCERTFIQLAHLTSHQRKHTGEKPYHCSICGKSYTASSTLLYHKRKHTPT
ncbi:zinc finger protein 184-like [Electrophorus electricus]|uniref:zinc finger protein 184-like n=1 Tax=Electrophorus electricus TaxID=8005 RepID=UPI0015D0B2FE|nr:zinc finger protein 184-like [Electrophorus electricus]